MALAEELAILRRFAKPVTEETFTRPERRVTTKVKVAAWLVRDML
jgi:hypothetical protein